MDLIRAGKAPEIIRRKGAEGALPLPPEDKIEILTLLARAPEADLREKALETLRQVNGAELRRVMANPQTAHDVLRFGAEHLLAEREGLRDALLWNPSLPPDVLEKLQPKPAADPVVVKPVATAPALTQPEPLAELPKLEAAKESTGKPEAVPQDIDEQTAVEIMARIASGEKVEDGTGAPIEAPPEVTKHDSELTQKDRETLIEKINRMSVVEKIKAALTGNMETRSMLIRDSNKIISRAVLQSPKISDTEAEGYAAAKNVSEEVLRLIASNRKYMKTYVVMRALINNPRAPIDVTLHLVARMNDKDLKGLSLNRNVPDVIRSMAIKAIKQKEEAAKPKLGKH